MNLQIFLKDSDIRNYRRARTYLVKEQSFSLMLLSKFLAVGQCSGLGLGFGSGGGGGGGSPSMLAAGVMGREEGALVGLKRLSPVGCLRWSVVGDRGLRRDSTAPCRSQKHHGHLGSCIIKFSYIP